MCFFDLAADAAERERESISWRRFLLETRQLSRFCAHHMQVFGVFCDLSRGERRKEALKEEKVRAKPTR
jgi:hypothetical protein